MGLLFRFTFFFSAPDFNSFKLQLRLTWLGDGMYLQLSHPIDYEQTMFP